ncbi:Lcl C-terminal domain-containing protein [Rhodanobacter sp. BL-MT-08]
MKSTHSPVINIKHVTINLQPSEATSPLNTLLAASLAKSFASGGFARTAASNDSSTTADRFLRAYDEPVVVDNKTRLMWGSAESEKRMTFEEAEAYVASLKLGGFDDWRLPDLEELESIRDLTRHDPCIDTAFFQSNSSWVWSRTPCAWSSDYAWLVVFGDGAVYDGHRSGAAFVRPVRSVSAGQ